MDLDGHAGRQGKGRPVGRGPVVLVVGGQVVVCDAVAVHVEGGDARVDPCRAGPGQPHAGSGQGQAQGDVVVVGGQPDLPEDPEMAVPVLPGAQGDGQSASGAESLDELLDVGPVGPGGDELADADADLLGDLVGPGQAEPALGDLLFELELGRILLRSGHARQDVPDAGRGDGSAELDALAGQERIAEPVLFEAADADGAGDEGRGRAQVVGVLGDDVLAVPGQGQPGIMEDLGGHDRGGLLDEAQAARIVEGAGEVEDAADDRPPEQGRPRPVLVGPVVAVLGPGQRGQGEEGNDGQNRQAGGSHRPLYI